MPGKKTKQKNVVIHCRSILLRSKKRQSFWDTHDSGDYEEYFTDVECRFDIKKKTHLISLDGSLYKEVSAVAKKKRIPTEKLVTRWIKEKLRSAA